MPNVLPNIRQDIYQKLFGKLVVWNPKNIFYQKKNNNNIMYVNWFSKIDHRNPLLNNVRRYKYTTGEMRWYKLVCKNRILPSYTALLFKLWVTIHEINSLPRPYPNI